MREFKFRAWDKKNKNMFTPLQLPHKNYSDCVVGATGQSSSSMFDVKRSDCVIMQFTGLNDKTGKEICEGDIIKTIESRSGEVCENKYVVYFEDCEFQRVEIKYWQGLKNYALRGYKLGRYIKFIEVIGNIYDNSELLKEVKK